MSQLLALTSAVFYGLGDFVGGVLTRRLPVWRVIAWSQLFGAGVLAIALFVVPAERVTSADLFWGAAAGTIAIIGFALLLSALAASSMSIVAPIAGATTAAVPVVFDLAQGTTLAVRDWAGISLAIAAVVLVGSDRSSQAIDMRLVGRAVLAGIAFGLGFVALGQTSPESALWPLVGARAATLAISFAAMAFTRSFSVPRGADLTPLAIMGLFDVTANATIALALQHGPLGVNSVLSSLYPAFTAMTAIVVLRERPSPQETAGIGLAMAAIVALVL
ncbi:MAG: DMT family transporter [Actinomycetota bacterium]